MHEDEITLELSLGKWMNRHHSYILEMYLVGNGKYADNLEIKCNFLAFTERKPIENSLVDKITFAPSFTLHYRDEFTPHDKWPLMARIRPVKNGYRVATGMVEGKDNDTVYAHQYKRFAELVDKSIELHLKYRKT